MKGIYHMTPGRIKSDSPYLVYGEKHMMEKVKEQFQQLYQTEVVLSERLEDEYEVLSCLKYIEQKQVYVLLQKSTERKAVLKCGFGIYREILREEAKRLVQMNGAGFPKLLVWEESEEACFLVREYVEGDTLQELMEKELPLTGQEALEAAIQVCGVLERLHQQNPPIIYRDVKPQNVVRTLQGKYVLIDLDTARAYKDGVEEDTVFMGTRGLASPEQYGYQQTDARTDVYGLGMLLLYLLTGGYQKDKTYEALPAQIKKIIIKCTEFSPKDRYSSMKEVERALKGLQRRAEQRKFLKKRKAMLYIITTVVVAVGFVLGGTFRYVLQLKEAESTVEFANPKIEEAVRHMLLKTDGSAITKEELEHVHTLVICGERVFSSWVEKEEYLAFNWFVTNNWTQPEEPFDWSDLSMFTNINTLVIEYQNVTEVPDLSYLPLVRVDLSNNSLTDISGLSGCTQIKTLQLKNNPIRDISALQGLEQLEMLDVSYTQVSDLSPVVSDKIKELYLEFSDIKDFHVLEECPAIENIRVSNASKEEIEQLLRIKNLKNFSVYEGEVDSLEMFQSVPGLQGLELAGCSKLTSLEGIENFPELTFLGLAGTGIESFPEHFYHDKLEVLEVTGTGIKEFKALLRCPNLRNLYVSEEVESTATMQLEHSDIEVKGIK